MSLDLDVVSQVLYLREGEVNPGDEAKVVERLETKLSDWYRDVVQKVGKNKSVSEKPKREDMLADSLEVENGFKGYWCEGEKCVSHRTHWVLHSSKTICWECRHDPCACSSPLVWDESEDVYYTFFLSCDGKTKENIWMSEPLSDLARISFRRKEKKRKENTEKKREEDECADNQQNTQNEGLCCHHHAKRMKVKDKEERKMTKNK